MTLLESDPAQTPGAFETYIERELADGSILSFEEAPEGWLAKNGKPRLQPWRAYHRTTGEKRVRLPSVTTLLGVICPKDLTRYGEREGIKGCMEAIRRGELDPSTHTDEDAVERVRALRLGADAHRDRAAKRGLDMHSLLEGWMSEGTIPNPSMFPAEQHGYIQALAKAMLSLDPEPVMVEQLVCSSSSSVPYAGRVDLLARIKGTLTLLDLKTQPDAGIFAQAHVQAAMYAKACAECGDGEPEQLKVVVLAADGEWRDMDVLADPQTVDDALNWYVSLQPIDSACQSANRAEKRARA